MPKHSGLPRSGSKQTTGRKPVRKLGGVMTELGRVTAINASTIGYASSREDLGLAVASPARVSPLVSCIVLPSRLAFGMTSTFTTGIRGTPPPLS
jgi:hypothetical protein